MKMIEINHLSKRFGRKQVFARPNLFGSKGRCRGVCRGKRRWQNNDHEGDFRIAPH